MAFEHGVDLSRVFVIAVIVKVLSAFAGFYMGSPWILGVAVPLAAMAGYIYVGFKYRNHHLSDERFADSCYYLGFIFTITAIVISLIDINSISDDIESIAVRFGAAMISTLVGIAVRVYIINFKEETNQEIQKLEEQTADTIRRLQAMLESSYTNLNDFQVKVTSSSSELIDNISVSLTKAVEKNSDQLEQFFRQVATNNQKSLEASLAGLKQVSDSLNNNLTKSDNELRQILLNLGKKVDSFSTGLMESLDKVQLPTDYFDDRVATPVKNLASSIDEYKEAISVSLVSLKEANRSLTGSLSASIKKLEASDEFFDKLNDLRKLVQVVVDNESQSMKGLSDLTDTVNSNVKALENSNSTLKQILSSLQITINTETDLREELRKANENSNSLQENHLSVANKSFETLTNLSRRLEEIISADTNQTNQVELETLRTIKERLESLTRINLENVENLLQMIIEKQVSTSDMNTIRSLLGDLKSNQKTEPNSAVEEILITQKEILEKLGEKKPRKLFG